MLNKELNILEVKKMKNYFKSLFTFIFVFGLFISFSSINAGINCIFSIERRKKYINFQYFL